MSQDLGSSCPQPVLGNAPSIFRRVYVHVERLCTRRKLYITVPLHSSHVFKNKKILSSDLHFDPTPQERYNPEANKHTHTNVFLYAILNQGALFSSVN